MYITLVFRVKGSRLVKPSLCLALLCPAFLVGVVRVAEYRNHWSDVLAGFLTGAAIATFLVSPSPKPLTCPCDPPGARYRKGHVTKELRNHHHGPNVKTKLAQALQPHFFEK